MILAAKLNETFYSKGNCLCMNTRFIEIGRAFETVTKMNVTRFRNLTQKIPNST